MKTFNLLRWFLTDDSTRAKRVRQIFRFGLVLVLFFILYWFIDFNEILEVLSSANLYYVVAGYLVYVISIYLTALQFQLLAKQEDINLTLNQIVAINLSIMFYLIFLPGTFLGSGLRWYKVSQAQGKPVESLAAVAFNRLYDMFLIVVFGLGFWIISGQDNTQTYAIGLVVILVLIAAAWFVITRISIPLANWVGKISDRISKESYLKILLEKSRDLLRATAVYGEMSAWDLVALVIVGASRLLVGLVVYVLLARSVGIYLPVTEMGWIRSVVLLFAFIPFTIAGGLGIREIGLIAMLSAFGISAEVAVAFSIILLSLTIFYGLVGGVVEGVDAIRSGRGLGVPKD